MRYTGPKKKLCRREGTNLFGSEKYAITKGIGGKRAPKSSDFAVQLRKKQTAKRMYGMTERQFEIFYERAQKSSGVTGDVMLQSLERRFDSVVYRSNFARTIMQARQFVGHAHFLVNGKKVNIPSYQIQVGDVITLREKMKESPLYKTLITEFQEFQTKNTSGTVSAAKWLDVDVSKLIITVKSLPDKSDFDQTIDIKRIIEFYSK